MLFQATMQTGAYFSMTVRKVADDSIVRDLPPFHNLVLNSGLDRMSVGSWFDRIYLGTGNDVPRVDQIKLSNFRAASGQYATKRWLNRQLLGVDRPYYEAGFEFRFEAGTATGNLTEVGFGWSANNSSHDATNHRCWNRTLIKDANGEPTTLTILDDEYLDVSALVRFYHAAPTTGTFELKDRYGAVLSTHTYSISPYNYMSNIYFSEVRIGSLTTGASERKTPVAIDGKPSGTYGTTSTTHPTPRSSLLRYRCGLAQANFAHSALYFDVYGLGCSNNYNEGGMGYQCMIDPPIPKNNTQEIEYSLLITWDRDEPI